MIIDNYTVVLVSYKGIIQFTNVESPKPAQVVDRLEFLVTSDFYQPAVF